MKKGIILMLLTFLFTLSGSAQKIKFKKGNILIDGKECLKYENDSSVMTTLYSLNEDEVLSFEYVHVASDDPKNVAGFDVHFDVYFSEIDKRVDLNFNSRKRFIQALIKSKVLVNCGLVSEKLGAFINKYSLRETKKTVIIINK